MNRTVLNVIVTAVTDKVGTSCKNGGQTRKEILRVNAMSAGFCALTAAE